MYDVSGIEYRIWGVFGIILLLGLFLLLVEKPWSKDFKFRKILFSLILIVVALGGIAFNIYRINALKVMEYTGFYDSYYRDSRIAPPLPFTYGYVFENEQSKKETFYIDVFAKKRIFPDSPNDLEEGKEYTIYFEEATHIILKIEEI